MTEENKTPPAESEVETPVVVEVEAAETPATETKAVEKPKEENKERDLDEYSEKVKRRIDKLTARIREHERREQAAIDYAKSVQSDYEALQERTKTVDQGYVTEFENRIKAQESALKHNLKVAINNGDVDMQAEINSQLAQLAVDKYRATQARQQQEQIKAREVQQQEQRQQAPQQQPQQQQQRPPAPDPRAIKWADENKWFGQDQPMTLTAFAIHKTLVEEEGYDPSSEDYYQEIDARMRAEWPHKFTQNGQAGTVRTPLRSPVAPANGQTQAQTSKKEIRLTPSQVAIAKKLGVSVENYAKHLAKLEKERR